MKKRKTNLLTSTPKYSTKLSPQKKQFEAKYFIIIPQIDNQFTLGEKLNSIKYLNFKPLKGTVSVISCDPPRKNDNARFKTVTLKPFSECERYCLFFYVSICFPAVEMRELISQRTHNLRYSIFKVINSNIYL